MTRLFYAAFIFLTGALLEHSAAQPFQPTPAPAAGPSALPANPLGSAELLEELRKGGYVIYFRHTCPPLR